MDNKNLLIKPVIICVDDELTILDSLEIKLRKYFGAEYVIETAASGEEALKLFEDLIDAQCEIVVVIADCIMPDIRGDELLGRIHAISPKTIKIMLTGQADIEAVTNAINYANLYRYIAKPWQDEDLKLTVKEGIRLYFQEKKLAEQNAKLAEYNQNLEQLVNSRTQELDERNRQLLASQKKYRALVEASQDMIWSLDAEGRYTFVNQAVKHIYGYDPEEMLGRRFVDFEAPEQISKDLELLERLLNGESVFQHESTQLAKDGRPIYLMFNAIALRDDKGNVIGITGTASDITKRKQTEDALKQSAYAADVANRAKSAFLSRMSHELRTPLNAILGFTQVMNRNPSFSPEAQEHLGIVSRSGEHLLELINDILEMSKIDSGQITLHETSFDLYYLLDTLKEMFQLKANFKDIQLIFHRAPDVPQYLKTDESKLRQVLINLIGNAIKFTEKGEVELRVRGGEGENSLTQTQDRERTFTPSPHLFFEVEDTGPGIAPEEMHLLFVPFEQTATGRKSQQGTGLGLPLTRQFVQLMGGDITVSSTVGKGTIFKFDVPLSVAQSHEVQKPQETRRAIGLAPDQPKYRLLVVDDDKSSRLLLVKVLASIGFELRQATNGLEAIALWESWEPHLILMDMLMPVMDGYEATRQIKAKEMVRWEESLNSTNHLLTTSHPLDTESPSHPRGDTVIIALTANAFEEDRAVILSSGCEDIVIKPFQEEIIFEKIARYLGVRYIYEEPVVMNSKARPQDEQHSSAQSLEVYLSQMPAEWVTQLYQAAALGSDCEIFQLIEQIPSSYAPLEHTLMAWVNDFRFDRVINLIQQAKN
jgi:PAS domain S-box-containing protein